MDKRKATNQRVKDRLFSAMVEFAGHKDWFKLTVTELICALSFKIVDFPKRAYGRA